MKKINFFLVILICAGLVMAGCGPKKNPLAPTDDDDSDQVIITMKPAKAILLSRDQVTNFELKDGEGEIWLKFANTNGMQFSVETYPYNDTDVDLYAVPVNKHYYYVDTRLFLFSEIPAQDLDPDTFASSYMADAAYLGDNDDKTVSTYYSNLSGTANDLFFSRLTVTSSVTNQYFWICVTPYAKNDNSIGKFRVVVTSP